MALGLAKMQNSSRSASFWSNRRCESDKVDESGRTKPTRYKSAARLTDSGSFVPKIGTADDLWRTGLGPLRAVIYCNLLFSGTLSDYNYSFGSLCP